MSQFCVRDVFLSNGFSYNNKNLKNMSKHILRKVGLQSAYV